MKKVRKQPVKSNELLLSNEIIGIILLFVSIFLIFSLVSFNPGDRSHLSDPEVSIKTVKNFGGKVGAYISAFLFTYFGYSSYVFVFYFLFSASFFLFNRRIKNMVTKSCGYLLLLFSFSAFVSIFKTKVNNDEFTLPGGIIGEIINDFFTGGIKPFFSILLFSILIIVSLILIAKLSMRKILRFILKLSLKTFNIIAGFVKAQVAKYKKNKRIKRIREKYKAETEKEKKIKEKIEDKHFKDKKRIVKQPSKIPEEAF